MPAPIPLSLSLRHPTSVGMGYPGTGAFSADDGDVTSNLFAGADSDTLGSRLLSRSVSPTRPEVPSSSPSKTYPSNTVPDSHLELQLTYGTRHMPTSLRSLSANAATGESVEHAADLADLSAGNFLGLSDVKSNRRDMLIALQRGSSDIYRRN